MATNAIMLRRPSDRTLYLIAAIGFPLLILIGYSRSYYFGTFFHAQPLASRLVHAHGLVMTTWVVYFAAQIALVRTKNLKLHMSMGLAGIGLAALVVVVGMATAYHSHLVLGRAPAGLDPRGFFIIPVGDMLLFILFFAGAIWFRRRPAEHKALMLMTAFNFAPAAVARLPFIPAQGMIFWAFGIPAVLALGYLGWHTNRYRKLNKILVVAIALMIVAFPVRLMLIGNPTWIKFVGWLGSFQ